MSALDAINLRRTLMKVRESVEAAVASGWDPETGTISLSQSKEAVQAVADAMTARDIGVTMGDAWMPTRTCIGYGRHHHTVTLCDDAGHTSEVRGRFRSRRAVRVWAKRRVNWEHTLFADVSYHHPQPLQYIKLDLVLKRD